MLNPSHESNVSICKARASIRLSISWHLILVNGLPLETLYLQHSEDFLTLQQNLQFWLQDNNHKLSKKEIQLEKTVDAGFLCWSTRRMDSKVLAAEITATTKIQCAVTW